MNNKNALEGKLLRFAAPVLYRKMVETFSPLNIHPHDVHGTIVKVENGYEMTIRFSIDFSQTMTTHVSDKQLQQPDEKIDAFFKEAAKKCKAQLISDYYKMMKL